MDTARWERLSPLLDELFDLPASARAQRLQGLRTEDTVLAEELEALIALEDGQEDFLAEPFALLPTGVRAGSEIGPYRLESLLGEGGMGQVWLAARADGLYQRRVALKLLRPGLAGTNLRLRFTRERQILARLAHAHIARLLDAGVTSEGLPYLALEYVVGIPITDYCREHRLPLPARLHMFQQICDAVSHAHANLIVHRDLKPSNILVTPAGDVRLLDFGIAKLLDSDAAPEQTGTGVRAFTLHYAAPEQIRGEPVTTMTDVYALGVVLYELLTDDRPYRLKRHTDAEWEEAILSADPLRPSQSVLRGPEITGSSDGDRRTDWITRRRRARALAGDLDNIVLKALSKRAQQRYPSVEALSQDLLRHEGGQPVHARAQSLRYRTQKYLRRHRWSLAIASLMASVLASALIIVAWQAREAVREASRAQAMQDFMLGVFENAGGAREGEPLDLRQLLETSIERGNRELLSQPLARAELLGVVARLHIGLGDYEHAHRLLEQQARLIDGGTRGAGQVPVSLRVASLTQRGRVLRLLGQPRACIDLMQPALAYARREQAQLPAPVADFYSQLGRCRRDNGERRSARQLFEHSIALRRSVGEDPIGEVRNLRDIAGLHADIGEITIAMEELQAARTQLRDTAGDRHPLLSDIRRDLGNLHHTQGRLDDAEREYAAALTIAVDIHGSQHPSARALRRQLAGIHMEQGRYAEARAALRSLHRELERRTPPDHPDLADSHLALGLAEWQIGETEDAVAALQRAVTIRRSGDNPAATATALFQLGEVLHQARRDREALPLLVEARLLRSRRYGRAHPLVGDTDRLLGQVEVALGQIVNGSARLARAVRLTRNGYGPQHPHSRQAELAHAIAETEERLGADAASGLARLDALADLPQRDIALRGIAWVAQARAAQLRCFGPERGEALSSLRELGERLQQAQPEGGAISREVSLIQASCAMPSPNAMPVAKAD